MDPNETSSENYNTVAPPESDQPAPTNGVSVVDGAVGGVAADRGSEQVQPTRPCNMDNESRIHQVQSEILLMRQFSDHPVQPPAHTNFWKWGTFAALSAAVVGVVLAKKLT